MKDRELKEKIYNIFQRIDRSYFETYELRLDHREYMEDHGKFIEGMMGAFDVNNLSLRCMFEKTKWFSYDSVASGFYIAMPEVALRAMFGDPVEISEFGEGFGEEEGEERDYSYMVYPLTIVKEDGSKTEEFFIGHDNRGTSMYLKKGMEFEDVNQILKSVASMYFENYEKFRQEVENVISELDFRGMVSDMTPGAKEHFNKKRSAYIGFDPTADSLHVGSLVQLSILRILNNHGHVPIALIGDATAVIGDPSGKKRERSMISFSAVLDNSEKIEEQIKKLVPEVTIENNFDWMRDWDFISFISDVGKHFTVNQMMAKESVKSRIGEGGTGMSFTEFSYQIVQANDFYELSQKRGCRVQMGGSDQWGNMTAGIDLIRKEGSGEAFAVTTPLLTKSDGTKFGKTEDGNIWLDPKKTSPYEFYQFWLNTSDEDAPKFMRFFSEKDRVDITNLEKEPRGTLQRELAEELTIWVHGTEEFYKAKLASDILFGKVNLDQDFSVLEGVPTVKIDRDKFEEGIVEYLNGSVFDSKGEVKRMVKQGGLKINREKVESVDDKFDLLQDKYLLVQRGKKKYHLLEIE